MPFFRKSRPTRVPRRRPIRRIRKRMPIKAMIKSALNKVVETKKHSAAYTEVLLKSATARISTRGEAQQLTQGTSYSAMTGHIVNGVGFLSKFLLHNNAANPQFIRHLILVNKRGTASTDWVTGANLFEDNNGDVSLSAITTNAYLTQRINKEYYKVLQDHVIKLGGDLDVGKVYSYRKYIPLRMRRYTYNGSNLMPSTNNIIEIWLTGEADDDATDEVVELTGEQTFYYKDA